MFRKKLFFALQQYFRHVIQSKNPNAVHSPFVFDFYFNAVLPEKYYYDFEILENLRGEMLSRKDKILVSDFGAGKNRPAERKISEIAAKSLISPEKLRFLFKTIDFFKPETILELGTSFGLSTLTMQKAAPASSKIYTAEGCPNTAEVAKKNFEKYDACNIQTFVGNLDETLRELSEKENTWDFVFLDANHQKTALLSYFEIIYPRLNENSVLLIDDIYWSPDMKAAFDILTADSRVKISMDFYHFGLLLFRPFQPKQHFLLHF
jgi:predicted O-methyltransferase YrrM